MKKTFSILFFLFLFGHFAQAQFNKPLQSSSNKVYSSQAKYNIGLVGGATSTYWIHFGGTNTPFQSPFNYGITGGLLVERMLKNDISVGIEALYAMRNTQLNYEVLNFPVDLYLPPEYSYRELNVNFQEINVQIPLSYYFGQVNSNIRPYVFVAPRVSVPIGGNLIWQKTRIEGYGTANQHLDDHPDIDTVKMNAQNMWQWNFGVVIGVGLRFKINIGNYYLLTKIDLSAHSALAYFTFTNEMPFIHASILNSFTYEEQSGESQNVIGASYIDPYLLGMRINTDATAKITIMFPLKKQLKGACMRWGEYD